MSCPSYDELMVHYYDVRNALYHYFDAIKEGRVVVGSYVGYSPEKIKSVLKERLQETEIQTGMMLLASIECLLRVDYRKRNKPTLRCPIIKKGRKDPEISTIIKEWLSFLPEADKKYFDSLDSARPFRNWIAHGRNVPFPSPPAGCDVLPLSILAEKITQILSSY